MLANPKTTPIAETISLPALDEPAPPGGARLEPSANPLRLVQVTLQVRVGEAAISVGEFLDARKEQVLVLDRQVDQPVDLMLGEQVVARGQLVAMDDHFAVRITELPSPLALASGPVA